MFRVKKFKIIEDLPEFALQRTLMYPSVYQCAERMLVLYPRDDLYQENPNLVKVDHETEKFNDLKFEDIKNCQLECIALRILHRMIKKAGIIRHYINMQLSKKAWRESASLIILAKNSCKLPDVQNFKVLVYKRPDTMKFMPNAVVFPGGASESADESYEWLEHFKKCGVTDQKLAELTNVDGPRPGIFQTLGLSALKKEISLRITAIREAFEELGVLICRKKGDVDNNKLYGNFVEEFNKRKWQDRVIQDPGQFIKLCKEHDLMPDIWKLYEWSAWLTPTVLKKRFETAFFLVSISEEPNLAPHESECVSAQWDTPINLIQSFHQEKVDLHPPQIYELLRIGKFKKLEDLTEFARQRNNKGVTLMYPIIYPCAEGLLMLYPGDDMYPENPNFIKVDYDIERFKHLKFEDLRKLSTNMHRCEHRSSYDTKLILNFDLPHRHISPISKL